jgi:hypothetical protein
MKYFILFLLLVSLAYPVTNNQIKQAKPKIYTLDKYKEINSVKLKKYSHDTQDLYWGIKYKDLALLKSKKLKLKLAKDYYMKCTIPVHEFESKDTLENLVKSDYFYYWKGVYEGEKSSPIEVVFYKNRALISYYGTDGIGFWVTIKLIVKLKNRFDIYTIHGWSAN